VGAPLSNMILVEADHARFVAVLERLRQESSARNAFLIDKNGQQIASAGEIGSLDPTSLASLTAGNVAATDGLAKLLGEREFSILFHEGEKDNLHINIVDGRAILLVLFDARSSLGLVRLRVKKATTELTAILEDVVARSAARKSSSATSDATFAEITDDDIDALFS
jgi:predicted regulator of Ras-like GTPase activity (Roadblock/LC7/MglB family)